MREEFTVRSSRGDYTVRFTNALHTELAPFAADATVVVVDEALLPLYPDIVSAWPADRVVSLRADEQTKSLEGAGALMRALVARRVRKNTTLIAIGGGIIQDVTAFSASVLYRGVPWAFVPTTLLAQCDSCIGSKTSINLGDTKNVLGNFYPPAWVRIDPSFLESLDTEDIASGIGEMLHYFAYAGSELFEQVIEERELLLRDRPRILPYMDASLHIKQQVIEVDELDRGERNKFNYGHTFGHALESASGYRIRHGQAVTVGMDLANFVSMRLGLMPEPTFTRMHDTLVRNFPAYDFKTVDIDRYTTALSRDKKNVSDDVTCILAEGPGRLMKKAVPLVSVLAPAATEYFNSVAPE